MDVYKSKTVSDQCLLLMVVNVCDCLLTYRCRARKEGKLMTSQKKTGPENLPLKAVIALMDAASAATAFVLSRPAKDPRTGSISPSLKALEGRRGCSILAIVYNVQKLSQAFVYLQFLLRSNVA